jgi:hypothetical protein
MRHFPALVLFLLPLSAAAQSATTTLPAGTQLPLVIIRPVWAASAKSGDPLYAQTTFPVTVADSIAIPSGSYVQGEIDAIVRPTRKSNRAVLNLHLTRIILASGYAIPLPAPSAQTVLQIQASTANDLLLDNGAQLEVSTSAPLILDQARVAAAVALSTPVKPGQFASATRCRPTPATSDTVIPGSPGTPGTPDTVIPGIDGAPPTVIPGIPATPGTPSTTLPGSPGYACPSPPLVLSSNLLPTNASAAAGAVAPTAPNRP